MEEEAKALDHDVVPVACDHTGELWLNAPVGVAQFQYLPLVAPDVLCIATSTLATEMSSDAVPQTSSVDDELHPACQPAALYVAAAGEVMTESGSVLSVPSYATDVLEQ